MKLSIRNFRGVEKADLDLKGIALVAGKNEAGKTSIAQAAQAVLTGEVVPLADLRKADVAMLIHAGTGNGSVELSRDGDNAGQARIEYPRAKKETEGNAPSATPIACGMVSPLDMERKQRAEVLIAYLKALPAEDDLRAVLADVKLTDEGFARLWKSIAERGWDGAHAEVREKGVEMKGQWREVTGENYGSQKAATWMPAEWETDLDGASEESLAALVTQAQEIRDAAIAHTAVSEDRLAQLRATVAAADEARPTLAELDKACDEAGKRVSDTMEVMKNAPSPDAVVETVACPECGARLVIRGNALAKPPPDATAKENQERRSKAEEAVREHQKACEALRSATDRKAEADRTIAQGAAAAKELAAAEASAGEGADDEALERARRDVGAAEGRLSAFRRKARADRLHFNIGRNAAVLAVLAPDGLRAKRLRDAIAGLNDRLAAVAAAAGWAACEITPDLAVLYRGTAWSLCSESGRFRARVMLQIVLAVMDGSEAVVVDGADILDSGGRNGLMKVLTVWERPALVCMTIPDRDHVPKLAGRGIGASYWLEGGKAEEA